MDADEPTIAFYDTEAGPYASCGFERHHLDAFIGEAKPGGRVLDLGCGGGRDSAVLRDAGFIVTSVDASPGLAVEAKRLWNVDVRIAAFSDLDFTDEFDGVWASASLHHAPADSLPDIFAKIHRATKSGGVFHATLKAGDDRRDQLGRFYCAMSERTLAALAADWRSVRIDQGEGRGYDGQASLWLRLRAVR